ncbi:YadA-like family protein [Lonepinella sp. BR2474]|uniref:YadA-like family protein n=1 Tax=Lonepinella sp. BR2474 TaxID=3434548 RepID=UPI003F6DDEC7
MNKHYHTAKNTPTHTALISTKRSAKELRGGGVALALLSGLFSLGMTQTASAETYPIEGIDSETRSISASDYQLISTVNNPYYARHYYGSYVSAVNGSAFGISSVATGENMSPEQFAARKDALEQLVLKRNVLQAEFEVISKEWSAAHENVNKALQDISWYQGQQYLYTQGDSDQDYTAEIAAAQAKYDAAVEVRAEVTTRLNAKRAEVEQTTAEISDVKMFNLGSNTTALGGYAFASGENATALGSDSVAMGDDSIAGGSGANTTGTSAIAIGKDAKVSGDESIAFGVSHAITGNQSGTLGDTNVVSADNAYALGNNITVKAAANNTLVLGNNITVDTANSVVLGNSSSAAAAVGTASYKIQDTTYAFAGTTPVGTVSVGATDGERTITNVAAGRISSTSTDAINGSQLYAVIDALNSLATPSPAPTPDEGDISPNTNTGSSSFNGINVTDGTNKTTLGDGDTLTVKGDNNINTTVNGNTLTIGLVDDVVVNSVTANDVKADNVTANNVSVGDISMSSATGKITGLTDGAVSADSTEAINGSQLYNVTLNGYNFVGDIGETGKLQLGSTVTVVGGSSGNIKTSADSTGKITVDLAEHIHVTSADIGGVNINNGGITNLNSGIVNGDSSDNRNAANIGDVKTIAQNSANQAVNQVNKRLSRGIASANALGGLMQATGPGRSLVTAGVGGYRDQNALAIGYSRLSDNGKVGVKFGLGSNMSGKKDVSYSASVGFQW